MKRDKSVSSATYDRSQTKDQSPNNGATSQAADEVQRMLKKQKEKQKQYYDKWAGKDLSPLQPGETIGCNMDRNGSKPKCCISTNRPGKTLSKAKTGQKSRRNRPHLRATGEPTSQNGHKHESESVNTKEQRVSSDE